MGHRWWIYQRERFPVLPHGLLIAVFSLSALSYSARLRAAPVCEQHHREHARAPPRHLEASLAVRTRCRSVAFSIRSRITFTPMPGPVGTAMVPSGPMSIPGSMRSGT